jgi:hypothetical protein
MKLKATLATLLISFASTALADTLEGNLTLALKVHEQNEAAIVGPNNVGSYRTSTLKTLDLIQAIGQKEGRVFTKKAKMIWQVTYDNAGQSGYSYRIRELGQEDLMITAYINLNLQPLIQKFRISTQKNTGSGTAIGYADLKVNLNGAFEGLFMTGPTKVAVKLVQSRQFADVQLRFFTYSMTLSGKSLLGANPEPQEGYVTGTFKISGVKLVN